MRIILTMLFFYYVSCNAATYYVANTGNDGNNGSQATPFQTIGKAVSIVNSYDSIKLNKGDTWTETIRPKSSYIYFGYYGTGAMPHVTGLKILTGLTSSGNVWSATTTGSVLKQNTVIVNDTIRAKGRYPNTGYLVSSSASTGNQIIVPHSTTSYTGSEIVVRTANWVTEVTKIASDTKGATTDVLTFTKAIGAAGLAYFYQNQLQHLDTQGEWFYDSVNNKIYVYSIGQPSIQYSVLDTLVNFTDNIRNIIFDGIKFSGGNNIGIYINQSRYDTVKNCSINNNFVGVQLNAINGVAIVNDSIQNSLSNGYIAGTDTSLYVYNSYISNTGIYSGMGGNDFIAYIGGFSYGRQALIKNNKVFNSGYNGIRFTGPLNTVYQNEIKRFCFIKQDGGGIYTYAASLGETDQGSIIRSNIVSDGVGASQGVTGGDYVAGIYLDDGAFGIIVDSNTVAYVKGISNITLHTPNNIIRNNLLVDTSVYPNIVFTSGAIKGGSVLKGNILYNSNISAVNLEFYGNDKDSIETVDSNYFIIPFGTQNFKSIGGAKKNFTDWKIYFPTYDVNSKIDLPIGITSFTPILYTNPSTQTITVNIDGGYMEANGIGYEDNISIGPYRSVLVWPSKYKKPRAVYGLKLKFIQP